MDTLNCNITPKEINEAMSVILKGTLEIMDKLTNDPVMSEIYKEIYL